MNLVDLERAATNLICADEFDSDSDGSDELQDTFTKLSLKTTNDIGLDLLVAAEAARMSSSDSELDSDDYDSEEGSEEEVVI